MEETISPFDRTVCTYFTLGGRSKSTANSQTISPRREQSLIASATSEGFDVRGSGVNDRRTVLEGKVVHIPDAQTDPEYAMAELIRLDPYRTKMAALVPSAKFISTGTVLRVPGLQLETLEHPKR